ncbi:YciI family protein [Ramlibacter sp. Leaf400]|uniref:YciI family protein n=1 Tax=Ramlibacter sp. Leaf400 TaxID=1736365 RepID=UPI0006F573D0|nr:YciI family protein [Ramlibacter sp. Leaf400]KQT08137.1 dehydrogenase [Ramlibacter sp. Leaf400]
MRFMVLVKATRQSEAAEMPSTELMAEMGRFNEELVKAGVMQQGEGLHPSSKGARVRFSGTRRDVVDGPFAGDPADLVAGFWIWKCASLQEAIDWVRRCPNPMPGDSDIEIRPIFESEDLGETFTPELREQEDRLREQMAAQSAKGGGR